jgi:hypothetical protein
MTKSSISQIIFVLEVFPRSEPNREATVGLPHDLNQAAGDERDSVMRFCTNFMIVETRFVPL